MATMIPRSIDPETKSSAEKKIFEWFNRLELKEAVVLHSLGMAHHNNNIFGEIDFVIISHNGILCVEVKGGVVNRNEGIWIFTRRDGTSNEKYKGPFEQVQGNMHSLRGYLNKRLGSQSPITKCQFACCVIMPECVFKDQGPDVINEVLMDATSREKDFAEFIKKSYKYWSETCFDKHRSEFRSLNSLDINSLVTILRGNFNYILPLSFEIENTEKELLAMTDEQYQVYEGLRESPRLLIKGSAGTGKTLLSMEHFRCAVTEGKKVLYLCYNRHIAEVVENNLKDYINPNNKVSTIHALLWNYCKEKISYNSGDCYQEYFKDGSPHTYFSESDQFYTEILPEIFLSLWEVYCGEKFDLIIIDEGQDILKTSYLLCISAILNGNIELGEWAVFYDENQNLFIKSNEMQESLHYLDLQKTSGYKLSINCRNTKEIGTSNILMTNIKQARFLKVNGQDVIYHRYIDSKDEYKLLVAQIRNIRAQGINLNDIVLLSKYSTTNGRSCLNNKNIPTDLGSLNINGDLLYKGSFKQSELRFYTIHSFKGLEAKVVFLLDVDGFTDDERRLLNYVGISRARSMLIIFYKERAEDQRQQMMINGYNMINTEK